MREAANSSSRDSARRPARRKNRNSPRNRRRRQPTAEPDLWICPGPEWGAERETCGTLLESKGRCPACQARRCALRKQERSREAREEATPNWMPDAGEEGDQAPWNMWS